MCWVRGWSGRGAVLAVMVARGVASGETKAMELLALESDIEQARRVDAERDTTAQKLRQRELQLCSARIKQSAIRRAIDVYEIDVGHVSVGVHYSPHGDMREREGATYVDRDGTVRVEIGDAAFGSAGQLGSTIGHEVEVHVNRQLARGVYYPPSDEQGTLLQEVEAYDYELASTERYGLGPDEVKVLRQRRAIHYRRLQWENRKRVDEATYRKW
jgi:hypothetical protein